MPGTRPNLGPASAPRTRALLLLLTPEQPRGRPRPLAVGVAAGDGDDVHPRLDRAGRAQLQAAGFLVDAAGARGRDAADGLDLHVGIGDLGDDLVGAALED